MYLLLPIISRMLVLSPDAGGLLELQQNPLQNLFKVDFHPRAERQKSIHSATYNPKSGHKALSVPTMLSV